MLVQVYSVFDVKSEVYMMVLPSMNDGMIKRELMVELRKPSMMREFPDDYRLYQVGTWDDTRGELKGSMPRLVCTIADLCKEPQRGDMETKTPTVEDNSVGAGGSVLN